MTGWIVTPAAPAEWAAALDLFFSRLPDDERPARAAAALAQIHQGELDPAGVLVLRGRDELSGVVVALRLAGGSGIVWPPVVRDGPDRLEQADALAGHALDWLRRSGTRLVQALLTDGELPLAESLLRHGMRHVTHLAHLRHSLEGPLPGPSARLTWATYADANPNQFHKSLLASYEGTLDCPEVTGLRTLEEILEGHRRQGRHDPRLWWLASDGLGPVGVLLLAPQPEFTAWELAYVGVVPRARRRGHGRDLVHKALAEARAGGAGQLFLGVDLRNTPAWRLYRALGFVPHDHRAVYLICW